MKQSLRITQQAFCCIATIAVLIFGARFSAAAEHPSIIGTWVAEEGYVEGKVTLVFKADNTMLWTFANGDSISAKYTVDYSTKPIQIDLFDFTPRFPEQKEDVRMRGILEFEGESRLRFEAKPTEERPKGFDKDAPFYTKLQ